MMSVQVWLVLLLLGLVSSETLCPDGRRCEGTDTCCASADGSSACCPAAHALKAVMCPDKQSECPEETTCCQLPDESWGCCPMAKAVCCKDKLHCCPEETRCDLRHSRCRSPALGYVAMREKLPARRIPAGVGTAAVTCPGGKSSCPEGTTCCLLSRGDFGCCPYPEAVCCSDQTHCCPANTTCDLEQARCLRRGEEEEVPLITKISSALPNDVVCPDRSSTCPDQTTCCQMNNGSYGCCPMPLATCCADHLHCCPEGSVCDVAHSRCVVPQTATSLTPFSYTPARNFTAVAKVKDTAVPCNASVACADGETCCKTLSERWACCPLPEAVCCEDHLHCCPAGTVCNLVASQCDDPRGHAPSLPWLTKQPALGLLVAGGEVAAVTGVDEKCDGQTMCPGGSTCCKGVSGAWACCPRAQAVCCEDQEHCCPQGYRCNLARQNCERPGFGSLPWLQKTPTLPRTARDLARPGPGSVACDSHTTCPQETTCCFMKRSASWGCCPLPKAVCCADQQHCCPNGYTCNARTGSCSQPRAAGLHQLPWVSKISAWRQGGVRRQQSMLGDVKCDNSSSCASGTTCCKLESGQWGCCPLVKAVCCADHEHCCPQGYTCNMQSGTCDKKLQRATLQSTLVRSALRQSAAAEEEEEDVPCDAAGDFRCSKQETCCRSSATEWACCPSAQAVCCADSQHCCPAGSSCDGGAAGCTPHRRPGVPWDRDADRVPPGH